MRCKTFIMADALFFGKGAQNVLKLSVMKTYYVQFVSKINM